MSIGLLLINIWDGLRTSPMEKILYFVLDQYANPKNTAILICRIKCFLLVLFAFCQNNGIICIQNSKDFLLIDIQVALQWIRLKARSVTMIFQVWFGIIHKNCEQRVVTNLRELDTENLSEWIGWWTKDPYWSNIDNFQAENENKLLISVRGKTLSAQWSWKNCRLMPKVLRTRDKKTHVQQTLQ